MDMSGKQIATALGVSVGSTTRRMQSIRRRTRKMVAASAMAMAPSGRPNCTARSYEELLDDWRKLANYNEKLARKMLREDVIAALSKNKKEKRKKNEFPPSRE